MIIELTEEQLKDLFSALISASADLSDESELELHDCFSDFSEEGRQQLLLRCGYIGQMDKIHYDLTIGYFDEGTGQPLETIDLTKWDHEKKSVESLALGRVGYVTDKLREYGIWSRGEKQREPLSFTGWQLN